VLDELDEEVNIESQIGGNDQCCFSQSNGMGNQDDVWDRCTQYFREL